MRTSYLAYLINEYKKGNYFTIFTHPFKYLLLVISRFIGRPLTGPLHASLIVNYECNLRCPMCDLWQKPKEYGAKGKEKLTTEEMEKVIDDFSLIGASGIGFTGGEPILREDVLHLIKYARDRGLVTHLSTNGYLISKREVAEAVVLSGLDAIGFSIDGASAEINDELRGLKGSYEKAIHGIKNISEIRKEKNKRIVIIVVCVVSEKNLNEIPELIGKLTGAGVDYVSFMPLHNTDEIKIGQRISPCPKFTDDNLKKLDILIDRLVKDKKFKKVLDSSSGYLKLFKKSFRKEKLPLKCYASFVACCVDGYGDVYPCFPWMEANLQPVNNVREVSLKDYWGSEHFNMIRRQKIRNCGSCYWNNQTELNLLFNAKNLLKSVLEMIS